MSGARSDKRSATSPPHLHHISATSPPQQDAEGKRACFSYDDETADADPDETLVNQDFLSSTLISVFPEQTPPHSAMAEGAPSITTTFVNEIKAALGDPSILEMISKAVAASVTAHLKKEIQDLTDVVRRKDDEILLLKDRVDELEQYSRRNNIRITGVPEAEGEDTDRIVLKMAETLDLPLTEEMLDRSHRVGRKADRDSATVPAQPRPIIVKFATYRAKAMVMAKKKLLSKVDVATLAPHAAWPDLPARRLGGASRTPNQAQGRVFVNDDMTQLRARLAARARALKRDNKLQDTWTRDGVIFLKIKDKVYRFTTERELTILMV